MCKTKGRDRRQRSCFPAVLLIMVGFMLAMGRYRGYRLTELVRFKAFLKADS